jgi:hypothetical protein
MAVSNLKSFLSNIDKSKSNTTEEEFETLLNQNLLLLHKTRNHVNSDKAGIWVCANLLAEVEVTDLRRV